MEQPLTGTKERQTAFAESIPPSLSYAATLKRGDHVVLFYDNLVVAAEYFCAYIEGSVERDHPTCFVGLSRERYNTTFEQGGGIETRRLENTGYLKHMSVKDFCFKEGDFSQDRMQQSIDQFLTVGQESGSKAVSFIIINSSTDGSITIPDVIQCERALAELQQYPMSVMCCYDSKTTIVNQPNPYLFPDLLKLHNHCLFQGVGIPTSDLLRLTEPELELPRPVPEDKKQ
jgi:hypothetical protein